LTGRFVVWRGLEEWLAEAAHMSLEPDRLRATGTQFGAEPQPYRADYELTTIEGWVTERLEVVVHDGDGERRLDLRRSAEGGWTANGAPLPDLGGALDCDLAFSPVTNTMPILRDGRGSRDYEMAWVSLPDLSVRLSRQRYEPIDERTIRYVSLDGDFSAELELDLDGLVARYPRMAERV